MSKKPCNVIWILADQHRSQAMSGHGDPNVNTPNMDRLMALGLDFKNAVSGFPLCCPFRGSMLTSRYPHQCVPGHDYRLPEGQETIADVFNQNGYDTSYFGKWHLNSSLEGTGPHDTRVVETQCIETPDLPEGHHVKNVYVEPHRRGGFQTWVGYENGCNPFSVLVHGHTPTKELSPRRLDGYETDALTDLMIDRLKEASTSDRPFFAVLSVTPPHDPYIPPHKATRNPAEIELRPNVPDTPQQKAASQKSLAAYSAMIENVDENIGRIRNVLRETGLDVNTHVIYFSDHGDSHGSNGMSTKMNPYEEAIRIPFLIGGAHEVGIQGDWGGSYVRHQADAVLNHVDIAPTTLGLCGIEAPDWMQGYNYAHYRIEKGWSSPKDDEPDSAYLQQVVPTGHPGSIEKPWRGIVTRDGWKYACTPGADWLLFNLNEDPYEQRNLIHNPVFISKRRALKDRLKIWVETTGDSFDLPEEVDVISSMSLNS